MFSTQPLEGSASAALPVFRTEPGRNCHLTIQSCKVLYLATHWHEKQLLCCGGDCRACEVSPSRCRGFCIALWHVGDRKRAVLLEAAPSSWSQLAGLRTMEGLDFGPGLVVEVSRKRRNSPLRMEPVKSGGVVSPELGSSERTAAALAVLFGLPESREGEPFEDWMRRASAAAKRRIMAAFG